LKECGEFGVQNREVLAEGADLAAKNPEVLETKTANVYYSK
tara:strand:+ start:1023 stop:1145 length:123 start_codon:yes stop_codon:yes gene_type:complete